MAGNGSLCSRLLPNLGRRLLGYCLYASNDCYCRADHQPVAVSYLSSCVSKSCTVRDAQIDVNNAITVYDGYCSSNGYLVTAPATTPASTTQGPIVTTTVYVTKSSSGVSLRRQLVGWDRFLMVLSALFNGVLVKHSLSSDCDV
jgi:hypothetical protein